MSIQVQALSKYYGSQAALDQVSFSVEKKEILGFLGPNGAGKSTMMKILTGYIPADSGSAMVNGLDACEGSVELRKQVGYLPEHNPLYLDMYVKEFLAFIASVYKLKDVRKRIAEVIQLTGLGAEQGKKIGALSKGYRQRVGLAQAIIHDPAVLILDEPTTGLDPNQLEEIRHLIIRLGQEKTVLLSTHIMQEVEAICSRVIIINKGQIVANDSTGNLKGNAFQDVVVAEFDPEPQTELFRDLGPDIRVEKISPARFRFYSRSAGDLRKKVFEFAVSRQLAVLSLSKEEQKLEEIFRKLTT
ncbi:MAG TPA: gliding motility-associated ABC transporter ATP-binding subunit GldA [Bacteroidia bacterium]|nr:gliding motility-associated ABC transporter ATP-binding subunit GldA [Bacteroidia bacterium]